MTEESEGENDCINQHKPIWRSQALEKLVRRLDKRITRQYHGGSFQRKERMQSSPSLLSSPPAGAPSWALQRPEPVSPTLSTEPPTLVEENSSLLSTSLSAIENDSELD